MRRLRPALTGFLLVAAFLLSFGALRHRALEAGIIHGALGFPIGPDTLKLSPHTLAGIWALTLDGLTAVGVLGVRDRDTRDWRAWAALALGLGLSLAFQTMGYDSNLARLQAAVPPLALALAVWIFEVPSKQRETTVDLPQHKTVERTETLTPVTVPRSATVETVAVEPLTEADVQALRRVKDDPAAVDRIIDKRDLDRGAALSTVERLKAANGDRRGVNA